MNVRQAYNNWASTYDTMQNKTRDLEGQVLKSVIDEISFGTALEIGCGTGKNTGVIAKKAIHLTSVDFSEEMLQKAKQKVRLDNVTFRQADITKPWNFTNGKADLVTFSLVLEHIKDLDFIFKQTENVLSKNGQVYVCELHPFKQYQGGQARFETAEGEVKVECYVHHVSEFMQAALGNNFSCVQLKEWFDDGDTSNVPRLISFLFRKNS